MERSEPEWRSGLRPLGHRLILCVLAVGMVLPAMLSVEFSGGMENFNVATAIESRRDGHWLIPYLNLRPRFEKPPLTHWITAASLKVFQHSLAWGARAPSLLFSMALLLLIYELAATLRGSDFGFVAALVAGTSLFFVKFGWPATYDLHLAVWVTATHLCVAQAIVKNRRWLGSCGAGAAMGLALMTKGPVGILQGIFPVAAFIAGRWWSGAFHRAARGAAKEWFGPLVVGLGCLLLIALPWPVYAYLTNRQLIQTIYAQVTQAEEASYEKRTRWHSYIVFFPLLLPWLFWFLGGFLLIVRGSIRWPGRTAWLPVFWLILPIAIMTFFPERRDRYLFPMLGPAAIICALGVTWLFPEKGRGSGLQNTGVIIQLGTMIALGIGLPLWGAWGGLAPVPAKMKLLSVDGMPWYGGPFAITAASGGLVTCIAGWRGYRQGRGAMIAATVLLMLQFNFVFMRGYSRSHSGRSDGKMMAEFIRSHYPDARVYNAGAQTMPYFPLEFLIYLDHDVEPVRSLRAIAPSSAAQIAVLPIGSDAAAPDAASGFETVARMKINNATFAICARQGSR